MQAVLAPAACAAVALLALLALLARACARAPPPPPPPPRRHLLAVFGSGGHTKELLALLAALPRGFAASRAFVCADTDATSLPSALALGVLTQAEAARVHRIARAREVGQPAAAAVWGTLRGFAHALRVVRAEQPHVLLVNGPGTCIPVCAAALLLRAAGLAPRSLAIVLVESVCRVHSLSASGLLAYHLGLADVVAVQWPQLKARYPRASLVGLQV